jgi:ABC-type Fe3+/spermidine/putrescine transport system ATPase subunit
LSNLDAKLRIELRDEIRLLHKSLGFSGLYVTHDQEEALALADRIILLRDGRIEQQGAPREVFDSPATSWAAGFLGASNRAEYVRGGDGLRVGGARAVFDDLEGRAAVGILRCRPDDLSISPVGSDAAARFGAGLRVRGVVEDIRYRGTVSEFLVSLGDELWLVRSRLEGDDRLLNVGSACEVTVPMGKTFVYDTEPTDGETTNH